MKKIENKMNWDKWLTTKEAYLKKAGYRKYDQNHRSEDFSYWKTISHDGENKIYQVGVLFYDFRKYIDRDPHANRVSLMYECLLLGDDRIDLTVSKEIDFEEFETMAKTFYDAMSGYTKTCR